MTNDTLEAAYALDLEFCRKVADVPPLLDERLSPVGKSSIASPERAIEYLSMLECVYAPAFQSVPTTLLLWQTPTEEVEPAEADSPDVAKGLHQLPYRFFRRRCF